MNILLIDDVLQWGRMRGLHLTDDLRPQLLKLVEELGEVAAGVARGDKEKIVDGIGDLLVVLIQFGSIHARELGIDPAKYLEHCLLAAWNEIKDRKGRTENGVFIKKDFDEEETE